MTPTDFSQFQADSMKAANELFTCGFAGVQKLTELNTRMAQTAMEQSAEQMKTLMAARDPKALAELMATNAQPTEFVSGYAREVAEITAQTNAEVYDVVEAQVEEGSKKFDAAVAAMEKNAPAGTEGAFAIFKQGVSASRSACEQVAKASKQFAQTAEANMQAASKAAPKAKKGK